MDVKHCVNPYNKLTQCYTNTLTLSIEPYKITGFISGYRDHRSPECTSEAQACEERALSRGVFKEPPLRLMAI